MGGDHWAAFQCPARSQSSDQTLTFTSQDGLVRVNDLPKVTIQRSPFITVILPRRFGSAFASNRAISAARASSNSLEDGGCCSGGNTQRLKAAKIFTGETPDATVFREARPVRSFQFTEDCAELETVKVTSFLTVTSFLIVMLGEAGP
jgi:hypothetical protein